jgi:hypothetical protein
MTRIIPAALSLGALLGALDLIDIFVGGHLQSSPWPELASVVAATLLVPVGFGLLLSVCLLVVSKAGHRLGLSWSDDTLMWKSTSLLGRRQLSAVANAGFGAGTFMLYSIVIYPLWIAPRFSLASWQFGMLCVGSIAMGAVLYVCLVRTRHIFAHLSVAVALTGLQIYYCSRVLYIFTRQSSIGIVHAIVVVGLFVFSLLIFALWQIPSEPNRCSSRLGRPLSLVAVAVGLVVSLSANCLLAKASHHTRVLVYERNSFTFRSLSLLPPCPIVSDPLHGLLSQCSAPPESEHREQPDISPQPKNPEVRGMIVLMIDSLRADRLDARRDGAKLMPHLSAFAAQATVFERAYVTLGATKPSLKSMVTSRYSHLVNPTVMDEASLSPILAASNVFTLALSGHVHLEDSLGDFDKYDDSYIESKLPKGKKALTSPMISQQALELIGGLSEHDRFFGFFHYYDPHSHYVGNDRFDFGWSEEDLYDAEVAYTDYWIGELFETLKERGLWDEMAIVVISDHGEEFWDHNYKRHKYRIYEEISRMVFLVRLPGQTEPKQVSTPVSGIDFLPTILELFGITPEESADFEGRSLVAALKGQPLESRPVFLHSFGHEKIGIVDGRYKLIINQGIRAAELYDLKEDPEELNNLVEDDQQRTQELFCELRQWAEREGTWLN